MADGVLQLAAASTDGPMATVVLPLCLAAIMFALGTNLRVAGFREIARAPRGLSIGIANLVLVAPLLAFAIAELFALSAPLAVGLVLLGTAPGGTLANFLTHLAHGDTALSVSLTALSSVASAVTVPVYVGLASAHFDATGLDDAASMPLLAARVTATTVLPLLLGLYVAERHPGWVLAHAGALRRAAALIFAGVILGVVATQTGTVLDNLGIVFAAALTLNLSAMGVSLLSARAARLGPRAATAISIELGVHNAVLAVAIGSTIDDAVTVPAAVYSSFMLVTAALLARLAYRRNRAEEAAAPA